MPTGEPLPPVDWEAIKPQQSGESRHYRGSDAVREELADPPIPAAPRTAAEPSRHLRGPSPPPMVIDPRSVMQVDDPDRTAAYTYLEQITGRISEETVVEAFLAGVQYLRSILPQGRARSELLTGTAETRTLAAAVEYFIDQVLIHLPIEEQERGEFLSVDEARRLVRNLRSTR